MSKSKNGKMVTFFIWLMVFAGILGVVGIAGYRIYSGKVTNETENIASNERKEIKDEIKSTNKTITKSVENTTNKLESIDKNIEKSTSEFSDKIRSSSEKHIESNNTVLNEIAGVNKIAKQNKNEILNKVEGVSSQLKEDVITDDHFKVDVTLIQDTKIGRLLSLTNFKHREFPPIEFKNYERSLRDIDWMIYNGSLEDFKLQEFLKKRFGTEQKIKILNYVFWGWMMDFSQSYILLDEQKDRGINYSRNGWVLDIDKEKIVELDVPDNGNELIKKHKRFIFLPNSSKFTFNVNTYTIETENSILKFKIPSSSEQKIRYKSSSLTKVIYEEFSLDKSINYNEVNLTYLVTYKRKENTTGSNLADFEYNWFLRIKENMEKDFGFEGVKKKLMQLDR